MPDENYGVLRRGFCGWWPSCLNHKYNLLFLSQKEKKNKEAVTKMGLTCIYVYTLYNSNMVYTNQIA